MNSFPPTPTSDPDLLGQAPIPWSEMLPGCFYYPCCRLDPWPVRTFPRPGRLFVYADYLNETGTDQERKDRVRTWLEGLPGFRGLREVGPADLGFPDWSIATDTWKRPECQPWGHAQPDAVQPFGFLAGIGESWLLYLATEAIATYEALFVATGHRPDLVALIQPGFGLGGGWVDFRNPGNPWDQALQRHPKGLPPHLVTNRYCHHYPAWDTQGRMHVLRTWDEDELTLWSLHPAADRPHRPGLRRRA